MGARIFLFMDISKYRRPGVSIEGIQPGLTPFMDTNLAPFDAVYKLYCQNELVYVGISRCICRMTFSHKFYFDRIDIAYYLGEFLGDEADKIIFSELPKYNKIPFTKYTLKVAIHRYNKFLKKAGKRGRMTERKMREMLPGKIHMFRGIEYILVEDLESFESANL